MITMYMKPHKGKNKKKMYLTLSTPLNILPPATPPFKSSTSQPGLLTSNDRITVSINKISLEKTSQHRIQCFLFFYITCNH